LTLAKAPDVFPTGIHSPLIVSPSIIVVPVEGPAVKFDAVG
jgi:hypothetical protein